MSETLNHTHISLDDCAFRFKFNLLSASKEDLLKISSISGKITNCNVCGLLYRDNIQLAKSLYEDRIAEQPTGAETTESSIGKVKEWLSNLGYLIAETVESLMPPVARSVGTYGELVMASRGDEVCASDVGIDFFKVSSGYYEFSLDGDAEFCVEVSRELANTLDCVAVVGLNETSTTKSIYELDLLSGRLLTDDIKLSKGKYGLYFIKKQEDK